jgi:hypothetical protein
MRDLEKGLTPPSGMFYRLESLAILHLAWGKRVVCLYSRAQEGSKEVRKEGRNKLILITSFPVARIITASAAAGIEVSLPPQD